MSNELRKDGQAGKRQADGHGEREAASADAQAGGTPSKAATRSDTRRRATSKDAEFTPLADAKQAVLDFGGRHPALTCLGAYVAVIAMGALLAWFTFFSGYNAPTQFVYAGF